MVPLSLPGTRDHPEPTPEELQDLDGLTLGDIIFTVTALSKFANKSSLSEKSSFLYDWIWNPQSLNKNWFVFALYGTTGAEEDNIFRTRRPVGLRKKWDEYAI